MSINSTYLFVERFKLKVKLIDEFVGLGKIAMLDKKES
jgi:hypothetical protein